MKNTNSDNLSGLLKLHGDLDVMFFDHQCKLLHFEFNEAVSLLDNYENALLKHMRDEEEILLPIYEARGNITTGGDTRLFLDEHEKMRKFIAQLKIEVASVAEESEPEANLIWILDREAFYKRLCSHHDKREKGFLYPELDRITNESEKSELLNKVTRSFLTTNAA